MATKPQLKYVSPEEYWELQETSEFRSEYISGEIIAMASGTPAHGRIILTLGAQVLAALRGGECTVATDISVWAPAAYLVPDVVVYCGKGDFDEKNVLQDPVVIFEVLSASTSNYDRGPKWIRYQQIATLMHYVLVSQDEPRVEVFSREPDGGWHYDGFTGLDAVVPLSRIGCSIVLAEIYNSLFGK